jgi:hypothetical protein
MATDNTTVWQDELTLIESVLKGYPNSIAKADALRAVRVLQATPPATLVPLMDNQVLLAAHNEDPGDWNDLNFKKSWYDGFVVGFRAAETDHGIKGEPK